MAANFLQYALVAGILFSSACSANPDTAQNRNGDEVLNYLSLQVRDSISRLESDIERCSDLADSHPLELTHRLDDLEREYGKEALLQGIGHLHFYNQTACERNARKELAYTLGTLRANTSSVGAWPKDLREFPEALIYSDEREIEYEIRYHELPSNLRAELEMILGDQPFNLIEVLDRL